MTNTVEPPETVLPASHALNSGWRSEGPPWVSALATALCAVATLVGWAIGGGRMALVAFGLAYLAGGFRATFEAISNLFRFRLSIDLLMILAALGAALLGDWVEGAILLFLFSLSNTLEAYAMYRTTRSIDALIQLRPREASLVRDGVESRVPIEALRINDEVRVRPGERFPVDGEVVEGETWADEATLTGESTPVSKTIGSAVFAGTINGRGSVLVRMTRATADTTLERIVRMVREAQAEKAPTQRFVESWQASYVAGVILASALVFLGARYIHGDDLGSSFYHAMVVLVVLSPCAVVIGGPAVLLSGIARAARLGVLMKGGAHLEALGRVDVIAFDKTGTITPGRPIVTEIEAIAEGDADELLRLAATVEGHSEHHLGAALIAEAQRRGLDPRPNGSIHDFHAHAGKGVHGRLDGRWIGVGREALFAEHEVEIPRFALDRTHALRAKGRTALIVVVEPDRLCGVIGVADQARPGAREAIESLRRLGVRRIILLTGDHFQVAKAISEAVGLDEIHADLLPDEKVAIVHRLKRSGQTVAMVGDGVNDAPALAAAQIGIAMGGAGTDVALEVADVVLMRDNLSSLPLAIWLGRLARRRIVQNMSIAFGMIGILLIASFFGLPLWMGVLGHEGSTVVVVLNGLRMLWASPRGEP